MTCYSSLPLYLLCGAFHFITYRSIVRALVMFQYIFMLRPWWLISLPGWMFSVQWFCVCTFFPIYEYLSSLLLVIDMSVVVYFICQSARVQTDIFDRRTSITQFFVSFFRFFYGSVLFISFRLVWFILLCRVFSFFVSVPKHL